MIHHWQSHLREPMLGIVLLSVLIVCCGTGILMAQSATDSLPDGGAQPPATAVEESANNSAALLLDAGDLVEVRVFDTPDLSGKFRVDAQGEITLPIGGPIRIKGLTAEQAQASIEQRFLERQILRDPHVEVFVLDYVSQGVSVLGEVKQPGVYPAQGKHNLLDVISAAGGTTSSASKTILLSHKNSSTQVVSLDLRSSQGLAGPEFAVRPGDRVVVTRAGLVYVIGDVGRPGGYLIESESKNNITVLQALALAQGLNKTAKQDAKLIRTMPGGRLESDLPLKKILANQVPDPTLQDGDILFVPVSGAKQWTEKGVTAALQMAVGVVIYGGF